jgi:hypothetical protein
VAPLNKLKHCSNLQDEKLDPTRTGNFTYLSFGINTSNDALVCIIN